MEQGENLGLLYFRFSDGHLNCTKPKFINEYYKDLKNYTKEITRRRIFNVKLFEYCIVTKVYDTEMC